MTNLTGSERARYVQGMFTQIAGRYDLMNRIMTAGQDVRWRKEVIRRAALPPRAHLLDLGAGTGDLGREALRQAPDCRVIATDFTLEMMRVGQARPDQPEHLEHLAWSAGDALQLPFPENYFDAVVSGFVMRNVTDVSRSLAEQYRVLKPGGRIVMLDTTPPQKSLLTPLVHFHLHTIIPALGTLVAGQSEAYRYLPDSTEQFLAPEQMAARMSAAGFTGVAFQRFMAGTIAIHWAVK